MLALRKLSPGGYEYLTGSVACADRRLEPGELLSDYYLANGYPAGEWFGGGAAGLGVSGEVSAAQMNALFGEGRHPNADRIEADMIAAGATPAKAMRATRLGRRFPQYGGADELRSRVGDAYKQHNTDHDRPIGAPIDAATRASIRLRVQTEAYQETHDGVSPAGDELRRWLAEQKRELKTAVAGYEMVFAPPKSFSVAWAVGDERTRELLINVHRQAVRDTVTEFEATAAYTRQGNSGEAQVDIRGITAAIFEHWDSRSGDPHLHTHVPISAKVQRASDGKWTTLDGRTVLAATVTLSESYNSRIRDLAREHGAEWAQRPESGINLKRPVWELASVPNELIAGFSQRAQQVETDRANRIVAFRAEYGREPGPRDLLEISRRAQYGTRAGKQAAKTLREHLARWRGMAADIIGDDAFDELRPRVLTAPTGVADHVGDADLAELAAATRVVVADNHAHWNRWNVEAEAHRQTAHLRVPAGARRVLVQRVTDAVIQAPDTVLLQAPGRLRLPLLLRRRDGESVFVEHNSQRFTTEQTLREESELVSWARRRGGHRLTSDTVDCGLGRAGRKLNPGQTGMVTEFARSGRRVQLALAPAGAGKTTAMRVFADAWRSAGGRVFAFGPSARAAQELGESIHATPHTLHQLTTALSMGKARVNFAFQRGDVLIVDEAAMAGTHTLHTAVQYALRCGADVRMVGDDRQLGAVEAGGAIRLMAHDAGAIRFRQVVRFADRAQGGASLRLAVGDTAGLKYYFDKGWVAAGSRETMRDAAHTAWRNDLAANVQSLLIVPTNDDACALNREARAERLAAGHVSDGRATGLHDGTAASRGDWIVTRENARTLSLFSGKDFVKNGDTWEVAAVHRDGSLRVIHRAHGAQITLPAEYTARHVELAYAATIHRTEGMTSAGNAHTVVPQSMTREQLYPAATRARYENRLYVETHHHVIDSHRESPLPRTAWGVLAGVLDRSGSEVSATEQLRDALAEAESMGTLVQNYNYAAQVGDDARHERLLAEHAPATLDAPAEPALYQTLRNATDLGWDIEKLVHAAVGADLGDADDPAAVLQWRIQQRLDNTTPPTADGNTGDVLTAVPWLSRPDPELLAAHPDMRDALQDTAQAITTRVGELRDQVATERPAWAAGLGDRPTEMDAAARWDQLAGLAAAYRETYTIGSNDPHAPLGETTDTHGLRARAFTDLTERWPTSTSPTDVAVLSARTQQQLDALSTHLHENGGGVSLVPLDDDQRLHDDADLAEGTAHKDEGTDLGSGLGL